MENTDAPSTSTGTSTVSEEKTPLQSLEDQIALLTELNTNVQSLRRPATFFQSSEITAGLTVGGGVVSIYHDPPIQSGFEQLKALSEKLQAKPVQDALQTAKESGTKEPIGLALGRRRKQPPKRPTTPESPQPFRSFQPKTRSFFPPDSEQTYTPLRLDGLVDYVKDFKQTNHFLLQIWTPTKHTPGRPLPDPPIVRFIIPDVVTIYLTLGTADTAESIIVESATAFGSREKKPPHAQSDFIVFQRLSQHLVKMLQSKPTAPFQLMMKLLASYDDLFVRPCTACQRVISSEGHIPPVARIWREGSREGEESHWDARHPVCLD